MPTEKIIIKGAREHNLKNINLELPRDQLIVITGLSGSGKSSLAQDTIFAEGQRRYIDSLSAYARQFLQQMKKPDVDYIEGLSPAISIEQKGASHNPRSIVGTVTEIYDYLRLLFARIGKAYCPACNLPILSQTSEQIVNHVMVLPEETRFQILAPIARGRKGEYHQLLNYLLKEGFSRVRIDGELYSLGEDKIKLDKNKKHNIEIVVDRLVIKKDIRQRLADSVEIALKYGKGIVFFDVAGSVLKFSENFACLSCGFSFEEISPRLFSFNSPYGACSECGGIGNKIELDPDLIIPNKDKSVREGAILPWSGSRKTNEQSRDPYYLQIAETVAKQYQFSLDVPVKDLPKDHLNLLLYGAGKETFRVMYKPQNRDGYFSFRTRLEGVIPNLERRYRETQSEYIRRDIEKYMSNKPCSSCQGNRLKKEALSVKVNNFDIMQTTRLSVKEAVEFFDNLELSEKEKIIARQILKEIKNRLGFLSSVGLEYITLDRQASTLSSGEFQRIRLATQIGSGLMGVLYVLDEPSIGLHQRDNCRLLETLKKLRDLGNTLLVVEHDEETIRMADFIVDIGPKAGVHGGEVVACGSLENITNCPNSITGQYLKGEKTIPTPESRRKSDIFLQIKGARRNNLKNIDVNLPLGTFICITGVSGSGKSSLINELLWGSLSYYFKNKKFHPLLEMDTLEGIENLDKVIIIDQSPIGRTPRSNPATYTGVFDPIRELFALTEEAKMRGYNQGRFSFNLKEGRCSACEGDGILKIEMHFLPDVYIPCEVCKGKRYNQQTLEVTYKGKNIADVLEMTVDEALDFFGNFPKIQRKLKVIAEVGLGYIKLGQPAPTLSGGEAQRVKLATELAQRSKARTLYLLDEPTTGLHFDDVSHLLKVLHNLVDRNNTVLVIEHNLEVIKTADYVIDLGPEGGDAGGEIIAQGTPEEIAVSPVSHTGKFLKTNLNKLKA